VPLFSIVIPTYNRPDFLRQALDSVQAQSFRDYEAVVVDDGSSEDVASVALAAGEQVRLVKRLQNGGLAGARNDGIAAAKGEYIAFLDSDDLWVPWTLQIYAQAIEGLQHPSIVAAAPGVPFRDPAELAIVAGPVCWRGFTDYFTYTEVQRDCGWILPSGLVVSAAELRRVGAFREGLHHCEDDELMLRLGRSPGFVRITSPNSVGYRCSATSVSKNTPAMVDRICSLIEEERRADVPQRDRAVRRFFLAQKARHLARLAIRGGRPDLAWAIYRTTAGWNVRLGRWAFLLGMPVEAVRGSFRAARAGQVS
jgi:glycosyltransferase involved in cell wall biosynthesis